MKKICFLCRSLGLGGAEKQLVLLAKGLLEKGYDVSILSFYKEKIAYDPSPVPLEVLDKKHRWDIFGFLWRFIVLIRQKKPDVLYSFLVVPNLVALLIKIFHHKTKIIWGIRSSDMNLKDYDWLVRLTYYLESKLSCFCDHMICNSSAAMETLSKRGYNLSCLSSIPNGLEIKPFKEKERSFYRNLWKIENDQILVAMVARFDPMKDHVTFLKAAALVHKRNKKVRFICIGHNVSSLQDLIKKLDLTVMLSESLNPPPYSAFDIFCLSSHGEGFSNVLGEAMSYGLSCIATDTGDSQQILSSFGILVPPKNSTLLAEGILKIVHQNPIFDKQRMQFIQNHFSVEKMISRFETLLQSLRP